MHVVDNVAHLLAVNYLCLYLWNIYCSDDVRLPAYKLLAMFIVVVHCCNNLWHGYILVHINHSLSSCWSYEHLDVELVVVGETTE